MSKIADLPKVDVFGMIKKTYTDIAYPNMGIVLFLSFKWFSQFDYEVNIFLKKMEYSKITKDISE